MSRVRQPYYQIRDLRKNSKQYVWPKDIVRAYKRINGKFVAIGWHVTWSDDQENVYLDFEF